MIGLDIEPLRGGLIVSCQAPEGSPLRTSTFMAAMASAVEIGGARAIRADGPKDVSAIKEQVGLPVIGIYKVRTDSPVYITPTLKAAQLVCESGADVIAVDATLRPHPGGGTAEGLIVDIRNQLGIPVMADVDTLEAGIAACQAGADLIATTLAGHTEQSYCRPPAIELVSQLVNTIDRPVIAEGGYSTEGQVRSAMAAGASAVVIGRAITDPVELTRRYVSALT